MRAKLSLKSSPCLAFSFSNSYCSKQKTKLVERNNNITYVTKTERIKFALTIFLFRLRIDHLDRFSGSKKR